MPIGTLSTISAGTDASEVLIIATVCVTPNKTLKTKKYITSHFKKSI
ncbi:MAG: hypothetical protein ACD_46C00206G0001 [uncultured bacterium]|nr:MAG: hypothetical protein ACD_46C00206G0001 [uncultured bacterium]